MKEVERFIEEAIAILTKDISFNSSHSKQVWIAGNIELITRKAMSLHLASEERLSDLNESNTK